MDDLKPCPNPECRSTLISTPVQRFQNIATWCRQCGMHGPIGETKEEAEAAWNALPRQPEPPAQGSIVEAFAELREAGGKAWGDVPDVEAEHRARWPETPTPVWSSERPKVAGLYLLRLKGQTDIFIQHVGKDSIADTTSHAAKWFFGRFEFAGPIVIQEPKEAQS